MAAEQTIYEHKGFKDREDYLTSLEDEYDRDKIRLLADLLGPTEDFDGLVTMLEDDAEGFC
jgi:hypothetical protein